MIGLSLKATYSLIAQCNVKVKEVRRRITLGGLVPFFIHSFIHSFFTRFLHIGSSLALSHLSVQSSYLFGLSAQAF